MTAVGGFFRGLVDLLLAFLTPETGTTLNPIQIILWASLVFGGVNYVIGLIKNMRSS